LPLRLDHVVKYHYTQQRKGKKRLFAFVSHNSDMVSREWQQPKSPLLEGRWLTPRMWSLWDAMTTGSEPETGTKWLYERDMLKLRRVPKVCTMRLLAHFMRWHTNLLLITTPIIH
jgi:hypothetical protein